MKKLFTALFVASTLTISGCGLSPMIVENPDGRLINGFDVNASNINKITDQHIHLIFQIDPNGEIESFPWKQVENEVKEKILAKGVQLSQTGRPVTITLKKFKAWGSEYATVKIARGNLLSGTVLTAGGSAAQAFAANTIDQKIAKDKVHNSTGDGKHFVPEIEFQIESENYSSNVNMMMEEAIYSYVSATQTVTTQAISEFFTPEK